MKQINPEIEALISLLDDPDITVHNPVIERLIELGGPAVKYLEYNWEKSRNKIFQDRIENVIFHIQQEKAVKDIKDWIDCRGDNLLYGAFLIARTQYPTLNFSELDAKIEALRSQIWLELNDRLTAIEKIRIINHFLFSVNKYKLSRRGVFSSHHYLINHVLDTRKGLPISLAVIYKEIAERLEIPVVCLNIPGNIMLGYHDPSFIDDPDRLMFFINPSAGGSIIGRPDVEFFLEQQKIMIDTDSLKPSTNAETVYQLAEGLQKTFSIAGQEEKSDYLNKIKQVLKSGNADQIL